MAPATAALQQPTRWLLQACTRSRWQAQLLWQQETLPWVFAAVQVLPQGWAPQQGPAGQLLRLQLSPHNLCWQQQQQQQLVPLWYPVQRWAHWESQKQRLPLKLLVHWQLLGGPAGLVLPC